MNPTPLDTNTAKTSKHPRPEQGFSPHFELHSYSCLSDDDDDPSAENTATAITSSQAPTLYPKTPRPAINPSTSPSAATPTRKLTKINYADPTKIH